VGGPVPPHGPGEPIDRQDQVAEQRGQPAGAEPGQQVDLEQSLRGHHEPLGEPGVVEVVGVDVGNAPPVPDHLDRRVEAAGPDLALDRRERAAGGLAERLDKVVHGRPRYGPRAIGGNQLSVPRASTDNPVVGKER
jgi:hypothetical protein